MVYLEQFRFPDAEVEFDFFLRQKRTCYDTYYPFQILSKHHFEQIDYEQLKRVNNARRKTQSQFIRSELMENVRAYYEFFKKHASEF